MLSKEKKEKINKIGYKILKEEQLDNWVVRLSLEDENGYRYSVDSRNILCRKPRLVDKHNGYSIYNINKWLEIEKKQIKLISNTYVSNNSKLEWECPCGNHFFAPWTKIRYRNRELCNKCSKSLSQTEKRVEKYLESLGINFKTQVSFPDCRYSSKGMLRFDFQVGDKLIEVQGAQHYYPYPLFGGEEGLKYQKARDEIKRKYCREHNIELLEVNYQDVDNGSYKQIIKNFIY